MGCWLKALEHYFLKCCNLYTRYMEEMFQKISFELPYQPIPKRKRVSLLHSIRGGWYVETLCRNVPPLKKSE